MKIAFKKPRLFKFEDTVFTPELKALERVPSPGVESISHVLVSSEDKTHQVKKRDFIKHLGYAAFAAPMMASGMEPLTRWQAEAYPQGRGDDYWDRIRKDYTLKPDYINLENGYYNIIPNPTMEAFIAHVKAVNYEGALLYEDSAMGE